VSNLVQKITFKSLAIALILATPIAPASAQGVPAGLLRPDSAQPSNDGTKLTQAQEAKLRASYARARKYPSAQ